MVRAQCQHIPAGSDLEIEVGEQVLDNAVGTQGNVEHFRGIRTPDMADGVVAGETHAEQIRGRILAQTFRLDCLLDEIEEKLVAVGRIAQGLIIRLAGPSRPPARGC